VGNEESYAYILQKNTGAIQFYEKSGYRLDPISPSQMMHSVPTDDNDEEGDGSEVEEDEAGWEDEVSSEEEVDYEIYSKAL